MRVEPPRLTERSREVWSRITAQNGGPMLSQLWAGGVVAANPRHHQHTLHFSRCGQRGTGRKRRNFIACSGKLGFTKSSRLKFTCPEINNNLIGTQSPAGASNTHLLSTKHGASLVAQMGRNLPAMQEIWVQPLGWEDPLEKEMATHSSILAWRIPRTEKPAGPLSVGSHGLGHDWASNTHKHVLPSRNSITHYG